MTGAPAGARYSLRGGDRLHHAGSHQVMTAHGAQRKPRTSPLSFGSAPEAAVQTVIPRGAKTTLLDLHPGAFAQTNGSFLRHPRLAQAGQKNRFKFGPHCRRIEIAIGPDASNGGIPVGGI